MNFVKIISEIIRGQISIKPEDRAKLQRFKGPVLLTITDKVPKTYPQIKTIYGPILKFMGEMFEAEGKVYNKEELKFIFKIIVGYYNKITDMNGKQHEIPKSLSKASKSELIEAIDYFHKYSINRWGQHPQIGE